MLPIPTAKLFQENEMQAERDHIIAAQHREIAMIYQEAAGTSIEGNAIKCRRFARCHEKIAELLDPPDGEAETPGKGDECDRDLPCASCKHNGDDESRCQTCDDSDSSYEPDVAPESVAPESDESCSSCRHVATEYGDEPCRACIAGTRSYEPAEPASPSELPPLSSKFGTLVYSADNERLKAMLGQIVESHRRIRGENLQLRVQIIEARKDMHATRDDIIAAIRRELKAIYREAGGTAPVISATSANLIAGLIADLERRAVRQEQAAAMHAGWQEGLEEIRKGLEGLLDKGLAEK